MQCQAGQEKKRRRSALAAPAASIGIGSPLPRMRWRCFVIQYFLKGVPPQSNFFDHLPFADLFNQHSSTNGSPLNYVAMHCQPPSRYVGGKKRLRTAIDCQSNQRRSRLAWGRGGLSPLCAYSLLVEAQNTVSVGIPKDDHLAVRDADQEGSN